MELLTECEEIVMKSVWELGGDCTLAQVVSQAKEHEKVWRLQTVATFLKHLENKGYVQPYKKGRYLHYTVLVKEEKYRKNAIRNFIQFWDHGKVEDFVSDLLEGDLLSEKEVKKVKQILKQKLSERADSGK